MTEESVSALDTNLYPDVAGQGGVGPAWRNAAMAAGIELGEVSYHGFFRLQNAALETPHGTIEVHLVAGERGFGLSIMVAGRDRLWGTAENLEQAARVASAWRQGSTIRQMLAAFPFLRTDRLAQAEEDGNVHEVLWALHLLDPGYAAIRPLLRAAHDNPRLSRLYPSVTHETLARFTLDRRDRAKGQVGIMQFPDRYEVDSTWQSTVESARTPAEAVELAAAHVPDFSDD
jgi:hypothetical protein